MFNHPLNIYIYICYTFGRSFLFLLQRFGLWHLQRLFLGINFNARLSSSANFGPLWKYKAEGLAQLHSVYQMRSMMASAETGIC